VQLLSRLGLDRQAGFDGPTWLDRQLVGEEAAEVAAHGYGREVREALDKRRQWLVAQGLAEPRDEGIACPGDLVARLGAREIERTVARLGEELGLPYKAPAQGDTIAGLCLRRVDLGSGSYALVERARDFTLVPWRPVLERQLGREIEGLVRAGGRISWSFGRGRDGPEIGL
jgi:hypothetical protein